MSKLQWGRLNGTKFSARSAQLRSFRAHATLPPVLIPLVTAHMSRDFSHQWLMYMPGHLNIYIYTCFYSAFFNRPAIRHIKVEWQIIAIANAVLEFWSVAIVGPVRSMHHLAYLSSMNVGQHRCVSVWRHDCFHAFYANKVRLKGVQQLSKRSMLSAQFCPGSAVSSVFFFWSGLESLRHDNCHISHIKGCFWRCFWRFQV